MKKILSLLLVSCSLSAFACGGYGDLYPKWSIGVIGYGNVQSLNGGMHAYFLPGVQFTHQRPGGLWAERGAIEFTKFSYVTPEFPPGSADMLYQEGKESRTLVRLGVERGVYLHRLFRPYAALDVGFQYAKSDMRLVGGIAGFNERDRTTIKGVGLLPAVGFKTYIGKKISVYAEYRAEAFINDVDRKVTDYNGNVDTRPTSETQFSFKGGKFIQAGIQVMF